MHFKSILLLLFLMPSSSFCQSFTVSKDFRLDNGDSYSVLGKYADSYLFMTINDNNNVKVQSFNENLIWLNSKEIKLESKKAIIVDNLIGKKNFSLFYTIKLKHKIYLKARKFDSKCNTVDSTTAFIADIKNFTPKLEIKYSDDKSKSLIYYFKEQNKFHGCVFDNDSFKVIKEFDLTLKSYDDYDDNLEIVLSNTGEIYLVNQNLEERVSKRESIIYSIKEGVLKETTIKIPVKYVQSSKVLFDNVNQKLIICGLHSPKDITKSNSVFALFLSTNLDTFFCSNEFTPELNALANGKISTKNNGVEDLVLDNIVLRKDGGFLIIAEQQKTIQRLNSNLRVGMQIDNNTNFFDYYYDNVVLISISPSGICDWQNAFFKKQLSHNDDAVFSSYYLHKKNDSIRLMFNDEIENETTISEYNISPNGRLQRNSVFSTIDKKLLLRFHTGIQLNSNESIIVSESRKKINLLRISF
jgi:hypothetical protein